MPPPQQAHCCPAGRRRPAPIAPPPRSRPRRWCHCRQPTCRPHRRGRTRCPPQPDHHHPTRRRSRRHLQRRPTIPRQCPSTNPLRRRNRRRWSHRRCPSHRHRRNHRRCPSHCHRRNHRHHPSRRHRSHRRLSHRLNRCCHRNRRRLSRRHSSRRHRNRRYPSCRNHRRPTHRYPSRRRNHRRCPSRRRRPNPRQPSRHHPTVQKFTAGGASATVRAAVALLVVHDPAVGDVAVVAVQQQVVEGRLGVALNGGDALQRARGLEEQHARDGRHGAPLAADAARRAAAEPIAQTQRRHGQAVVLLAGRFRVQGLPAFGGQERVLGGDEGLAAVEGVEPPAAQPRSAHRP